MTPEQFAYWLQGFTEVTQRAPTEQEWKIIKDHLATVFNKVTPTYQPPKINPFPYDSRKPEPIPGPYRPFETSPFTSPPTVICSSGAGKNWTSGAGNYNPLSNV